VQKVKLTQTELVNEVGKELSSGRMDNFYLRDEITKILYQPEIKNQTDAKHFYQNAEFYVHPETQQVIALKPDSNNTAAKMLQPDGSIKELPVDFTLNKEERGKLDEAFSQYLKLAPWNSTPKASTTTPEEEKIIPSGDKDLEREPQADESQSQARGRLQKAQSTAQTRRLEASSELNRQMNLRWAEIRGHLKDYILSANQLLREKHAKLTREKIKNEQIEMDRKKEFYRENAVKKIDLQIKINKEFVESSSILSGKQVEKLIYEKTPKSFQNIQNSINSFMQNYSGLLSNNNDLKIQIAAFLTLVSRLYVELSGTNASIGRNGINQTTEG
jgi:hypothetical protein